ncbi:uncharacterized protein TNCV_1149651 [Trichonephila clavipes]|nr:uncharacterized protein TNCV_1149651 [Trichonephila clavipes]
MPLFLIMAAILNLNYQRYKSNSPYPRRNPQHSQSRSSSRRSPVRTVYTAAKLIKNFVSVAVNGHVVKALVDSGADYSVVSEQLRTQLRTPMFSEHNPIIRTVCGKVEAILDDACCE